MLPHQSRGVTIAGCSPFGTALANTLYYRDHKMVILDKNRESFRHLSEELDGSELGGDPIDPRVLRKVGVERTGMIIATTQDDNSNLLTSQMANNIFQVGHVYTRLDNTSRCRLVTNVPIQSISLYSLPADNYKDLAGSVNQEMAV